MALLTHILYVYKQAGRLWGNLSHAKLTGLGAVRSQADPTLHR